MDDSNVKVVVRVRPLSVAEESRGCTTCTVLHGDNEVSLGPQRFAFDGVLPASTGQGTVYVMCASPLVESVMDGYNATLMAYGQTGSGKTFTVGSQPNSFESDENRGLIARSVAELFANIGTTKQQQGQREEREETTTTTASMSMNMNMNMDDYTTEFTVRCTFLEVYGDELRDLLLPVGSTPMPLGLVRVDNADSVTGLHEEEVMDVDEVLVCLERGGKLRTTASHNLNAVSSRSHAIFTVEVDQRRTKVIAVDGKSQEVVQRVVSKLRFVDLAGSERAKRTGATTGSRLFKEGVSINMGLLALGNVISALGDESKRGKVFVPYRDSKLTRILQDSLGGNSKTCMICCVSPSDSHFSETFSALKYAHRARNIRNKAIVNVDSENVVLRALQAELIELRERLRRCEQPPENNREDGENNDPNSRNCDGCSGKNQRWHHTGRRREYEALQRQQLEALAQKMEAVEESKRTNAALVALQEKCRCLEKEVERTKIDCGNARASEERAKSAALLWQLKCEGDSPASDPSNATVTQEELHRALERRAQEWESERIELVNEVKQARETRKQSSARAKKLVQQQRRDVDLLLEKLAQVRQTSQANRALQAMLRKRRPPATALAPKEAVASNGRRRASSNMAKFVKGIGGQRTEYGPPTSRATSKRPSTARTRRRSDSNIAASASSGGGLDSQRKEYVPPNMRTLKRPSTAQARVALPGGPAQRAPPPPPATGGTTPAQQFARRPSSRHPPVPKFSCGSSSGGGSAAPAASSKTADTTAQRTEERKNTQREETTHAAEAGDGHDDSRETAAELRKAERECVSEIADAERAVCETELGAIEEEMGVLNRLRIQEEDARNEQQAQISAKRALIQELNQSDAHAELQKFYEERRAALIEKLTLTRTEARALRASLGEIATVADKRQMKEKLAEAQEKISVGQRQLSELRSYERERERSLLQTDELQLEIEALGRQQAESLSRAATASQNLEHRTREWRRLTKQLGLDSSSFSDEQVVHAAGSRLEDARQKQNDAMARLNGIFSVPRAAKTSRDWLKTRDSLRIGKSKQVLDAVLPLPELDAGSEGRKGGAGIDAADVGTSHPQTKLWAVTGVAYDLLLKAKRWVANDLDIVESQVETMEAIESATRERDALAKELEDVHIQLDRWRLRQERTALIKDVSAVTSNDDPSVTAALVECAIGSRSVRSVAPLTREQEVEVVELTEEAERLAARCQFKAENVEALYQKLKAPSLPTRMRRFGEKDLRATCAALFRQLCALQIANGKAERRMLELEAMYCDNQLAMETSSGRMHSLHTTHNTKLCTMQLAHLKHTHFVLEQVGLKKSAPADTEERRLALQQQCEQAAAVVVREHQQKNPKTAAADIQAGFSDADGPNRQASSDDTSEMDVLLQDGDSDDLSGGGTSWFEEALKALGGNGVGNDLETADDDAAATAGDKGSLILPPRHGAKAWAANSWRWRCASELKGHTNNVLALAPLKGLLASGSYDKSIRVWSVRGGLEGKCLTSVENAHTGPVRCLTRVGDLLASCSQGDEGVIKLWEPETWQCVQVIDKAHSNTIRCLSAQRIGESSDIGGCAQPEVLSPGGAGAQGCGGSWNSGILASGSDDGTVRLWDPRTPFRTAHLLGTDSPVHSLAWCGGLLAAGSWLQTFVYEPRKWRLIKLLRGYDGFVPAMASRGSLLFSADGVQAAGKVRVWDLKSFKYITTLRPQEKQENGAISSLMTFGPALVAGYKGQGAISAWDLDDGSWRNIVTLNARAPVHALAGTAKEVCVGLGGTANVVKAYSG